MKDFKMIDFNSSMPLHYQVKEYILDQIKSGELKPGDMLPSEIIIANDLGVSRNTVRQAVLSLVSENYLYRKQGKGTFINYESFSRGVPVLTGFHEYIYGLNRVPSSYFDQMDLVNAPIEINRYMEIKDHSQLVYLHRIVKIDAETVGVHEIYIPPNIWSKIDLPLNSLKNQSLYNLFKTKCNIDLVRGDETIYIRQSTQKERDILSLQKEDYVFIVARLLYDQNDLPVCYAENIYNPAKFKYYIKYESPVKG